ncbi:integrase, catalytic region, zinc finger, CCHC-type containing protein [Tanacetum coccineum]
MGNQFRQYAGQNVRNLNGYNAVQNVRNLVVQNAVQNPSVQNNGNGNVVAARVEGNSNGNTGNQIQCYNYRGLGYLARNCRVRPRKIDAAYLQTHLLIAQKEEARIQLQAKEFNFMAAGDLDEIEEVNANCILMANLQQASTSGTQIDKAPVYDSDGSAEVHFLRSKDEAPEEIKIFLKKITVLFQALVIIVTTNNNIEFKNQVLQEYFNSVGISHQASSVRTPQQNGVVERRNHTLMEAARTMLIFSHAPLFLWSKAIATACTLKIAPSFIVDSTKHHTSLSTAQTKIMFISTFMRALHLVYNRRTKKIMETMNVTFDELLAMAFEQGSSKPRLQGMTS